VGRYDVIYREIVFCFRDLLLDYLTLVNRRDDYCISRDETGLDEKCYLKVRVSGSLANSRSGTINCNTPAYHYVDSPHFLNPDLSACTLCRLLQLFRVYEDEGLDSCHLRYGDVEELAVLECAFAYRELCVVRVGFYCRGMLPLLRFGQTLS